MLRSRLTCNIRSQYRTKKPFQPRLEALERREVFSVSPYLIPVAPSVEITPIITVNPQEAGAVASDGQAQNGYKMVGIPDGLGAFDNGDGTFTVLMNQEIAVGGSGAN